ncbi:MAG: 3-dehydroquinate synthase [Proteobacteria bacterium]|nr:MAG: 3-dehydroquinate synthase [Pseudomonadota bacterium]
MLPSIVPQSRPVVLSGLMGSGKSTTGALLAARLGWSFVDLDRELEARRGKTVAALFRDEGEAAFRTQERALALELLADGVPRILALGGFTLGDRAVRHRILDSATVVTLEADAGALAARIQDDATRPLLQGTDKALRLAQLLEERSAAYGECHLRIDTTDRTPEEVADEIAHRLGERRLTVPLGERSYGIQFVDDAPEALIDTVVRLAPSSLVVVTDSNVMRLRRGPLEAMLDAVLLPRTVVTLAPGEASKNLASISTIWDAALGARVDRHALVIAYGGGVVGDMAGFAASTLLRGIRVLQVPTTVLSMVDSSVGGKTGIDHGTGKNLIGSFWQPSAVFVDVAHVSTLPPRELRAGLAEIVKIALTHDAVLFAKLERHAESLAKDHGVLLDVIAHGVALKAKVVRDDEHERGDRALLNLGHTLGHALEIEGNYTRFLHGEAVALGLRYELEMAEHLGLAPAGLATRATELLARLGLPTTVEAPLYERSLAHLGTDKKRRGKELVLSRFSALGSAQVELVATSEVTRVLRDLAAKGDMQG